MAPTSSSTETHARASGQVSPVAQVTGMAHRRGVGRRRHVRRPHRARIEHRLSAATGAASLVVSALGGGDQTRAEASMVLGGSGW
jgi:hypothetical protein